MSEAGPAPLCRRPAIPSFFDLVTLDSVDSTNDEAARRAAAGAREGLLVWALRQSKGRGRGGRRWHSPAGNLHCSLLLRVARDPAGAAELAFVAALAVRQCAAELVSGCRVLCKWPNDVLIDGLKVAGVLLEARAEERATRVVVGIGVNVVDHPGDALHPATHLAAHGGRGVTAAAVLERLAPALLGWCELWLREGFAPIREAWLAHAAGLGQPLTARLPERELRGRFLALDERGALELKDANGEIHRVRAGDVFLAAAGPGIGAA